MNDLSLESALKRLPEPSPPPGLAAAVLLRAARIDDEREAARRQAAAAASRGAQIDRLSWATALTGLVVAVGAEVFALVSGQATVQLAPSPFRIALLGAGDAGFATLAAAVGVGLCLAGLFRSVEPRHPAGDPPTRGGLSLPPTG
jgi:hypothetical protein